MLDVQTKPLHNVSTHHVSAGRAIDTVTGWRVLMWTLPALDGKELLLPHGSSMALTIGAALGSS